MAKLKLQPLRGLARLAARAPAPALCILEAASTEGGQGARYLLGRWLDGVPLEALEEEGPPRPVRPLSEIIPVVVADDHRLLLGLLSEAAEQAPPFWDGQVGAVRLRLTRVAGGRLGSRIRRALAEAPARALTPPGPSGVTVAAVVPLADPGLRFRPIHRALRGLAGFEPARFLRLVADFAQVDELPWPLALPAGRGAVLEELARMAKGRHAVGLVLPDGTGKVLRFREGLDWVHLHAAPRNPTLRSLDLPLLNALVFRTALGLVEPGRPAHPNLRPIEDVDALVTAVLRGDYQAGFLLNPPPTWEIRAVIEARQKLPASTLRLHPAPPPGLLDAELELEP